MSERARREDTLEKMREMHPEAENEESLTALAMQADKKTETASGIKWLLSGAVILVAGLILAKGFSVWILLAVTGIAANGLRLTINDARIAQRYRTAPEPEEGGQLTRERILLDCRKGLRVTDGRFYLVKAPLYDMGVDYDTGLLQLFSQRFFFRSKEGIYSMSVKSRQYRTAALGAEYYLVIPKSDKFSQQIPIRAYQAASWELGEDLLDCIGNFPSIPKNPEDEGTKEGKTGKLLPGISIALSFLSMWVPVAVSIFLCLGALALAVAAIRRAKNIWTTGAMMFSISSTVVMLLFLVPTIIR